MADFTITIQNSLRLFGGGPSTKWGGSHPPMVWGTSKWGEGNPMIWSFIRGAYSNSLTLSDEYSKQHGKLVENTLACLGGPSSIMLKDAAGYSEVFADDTTNAVTRAIAAYATPAAPSSTWVSSSTSSTSWGAG